MNGRTIKRITVCMAAAASMAFLSTAQAQAQCARGNYYGGSYGGYYGNDYSNGYGYSYYPQGPYANSGGTYQSFSYEPGSQSSVGSTRENPSGMVSPMPTYEAPIYGAPVYGSPRYGNWYYSPYSVSNGGTAGHPSPY